MNILIADDQYEWLGPLSEICRKAGHEVVSVRDGEDVLKMSEETLRGFHAALLDYKMSTTGLEAGKHIKKHSPDTLYMMLTAHSDRFTVEKAVEAIKAGFFDYIDKNGDYKAAVERFLQHATERARVVSRYRRHEESVYTLNDIVGESQKVRDLRDLIETVAPADAAVLILGESGTGKELVAGAIHSLSTRREEQYVRINCAAIPENLLESELFGHEKGAFTGAVKQKLGRVEEADGGTIFLDEIGDMSRPLQAKLLRFLEDGTFTRVGGNEELFVRVRFIAATNRDIVEAIRQNQFREDLFHRLNVVQLQPPPLRERGNDVVLLAVHFLQHFNATRRKQVKSLSAETKQKLLSYHWPGNVRELRNVIERALIIERTDQIVPGSLPDFQLETRLRKEVVVASPPDWGSIPPSTTSPKGHLYPAADSKDWTDSEILKVREELVKYDEAYQKCKASGIESPTFTNIGKLLVPREKNTHTEISNFFSEKARWEKMDGKTRVAIIKWLLRQDSKLCPDLRNLPKVANLA